MVTPHRLVVRQDPSVLLWYAKVYTSNRNLSVIYSPDTFLNMEQSTNQVC